SADDPLHPAVRGCRRVGGAAHLRLRAERDGADRHHPADRHREEERHHDDRLRARRRAGEGLGAGRRDLRGEPASLPAHHDDHHGRAPRRAAAGTQPRRRRGAAQATGHCNRGRAHREPGAHALHHAGDLPRFRSAGAALPRRRREAAPRAPARRDSVMNISAPFITRPVATTLLTIGLAVAGILGFRLLPVASLPQVDFPTIQVSAQLPGASPETMASSVAAPLERQFGRIAGVTEMTSASSLGATSIVLQFDLDRNIDGAARDVQAAINAARTYLPPALPMNPTYRKVNPADAPIIIFALTSDSKSTGEMYDLASSILQQRLSRVEGVGQVYVGGSSLPAVRVDLNPQALSRHNVGLEGGRSTLA